MVAVESLALVYYVWSNKCVEPLLFAMQKTEVLITAAQDQAICTKAYDVNLLNFSQDPLRGICCNSNETILS